MVLERTFQNDINFLQSNHYHMEIQGMPMLSLMINEIDFPGLQFGSREHPTPLLDYSHQGDTLVYDPLTVTFNVDEYMESYIEIWKWMMALGFPRSTNEFKALQLGDTPYSETADIGITIMSSKSRPIFDVKFIDAFPTVLAPLQFTEKTQEPVPVVCSVTFNYSWFVINNLEVRDLI